MLFLKISVSVPLKFLPSGPLQKNGTSVEFLKTRFLNLYACKNHTGNIDLYDTSDVQKYLKFFESRYSKLNISSKKVRDTLKLLGTKKDVETDLKCLGEMSSQGNKELEDLIEKDKNVLLQRIKDLKGQILSSLIPIDEDNSRNVELQVVPNIGGEEAKLFSQELFEMYLKYVNYKNWEYVKNPDNGYVFISGDNIYGQLRHEMGIHRVQRVPETEISGRTHTSTCTVLVLPQPRPGEIVFNEKEVIIETMRSSGPGGQNVNKTESCVRLIHKPTGIVVESQTSRFQYENKKLAFEKLRNIIFTRKRSELEKKIKKLKKQHVATNIYSDKIRTYNYNQNRVTDHRAQYTVHNIRGFLSGSKELDRMISSVREHFVQQELIFHIQDVLESKEYKMFENQN